MNEIKIALLASRDGEGRVCVSPAYFNALWHCGAIGSAIPHRTDEDFISQVAEKFDGFIFCGGDDLNPELYGEENQGLSKNICSVRDGFEKALFKKVYALDKPILGICRGEQAMNVFLGGSLYQHIDGHSQTTPIRERVQTTLLERGSLLHEIVQEDEILTNTFHHQNIKELAEPLVCDARSSDGYIEAVHAPERHFCLGVQWHPEAYFEDDSSSVKIFEAFVDACRKSRDA